MQLLASQVGHRVRDLEGYGVPFVRVKDDLRRQLAPGHSSPRCISVQAGDYPQATEGLSITLPLLKQVVSRGVRLVDMGLVVHPRKGDISLREVKEALRKIMWEGVSIVRSRNLSRRPD